MPRREGREKPTMNTVSTWRRYRIASLDRPPRHPYSWRAQDSERETNTEKRRRPGQHDGRWARGLVALLTSPIVIPGHVMPHSSKPFIARVPCVAVAGGRRTTPEANEWAGLQGFGDSGYGPDAGAYCPLWRVDASARTGAERRTRSRRCGVDGEAAESPAE